MSGICGLFNLDGKPVASSELAAMNAMLEKRGPDGAGQWVDGTAGLGHTLLASTPKAEAESQPFVHQESGCVITADVRLDNRSELIASLAPSRPDGSIGDAELILLSYLRWGEDCPNHLLGDFAFVIRDPGNDRLFCARDHSGMRLLYYHHEPNRLFVVASSPKAVLVLPQVPYAINQGRIADYLVSDLEWIDYTSTFFDGVYRLPPGHRISISPQRMEISEYWRPAPGARPGLHSDGEWYEEFLELFTRSVECRLRAPADRLGSTLSGGIDSGAVVAVASAIFAQEHRGKLPTYSGTLSPDPAHLEAREVDAIGAATAMERITPTLILPTDLGAETAMMMSDNEEPFDGNCLLLKAIYDAAGRDGRKVLLDGAAADVLLGEGTYVARLIRKGRLVTAVREIAGANRFWGGTPLLNDLVLTFRSALAPEFITRMRRQRRAGNPDHYFEFSPISRKFAESVHIQERICRQEQMFPRDREADYASELCRVIRPNLTAGRERYARLAATAGTEASDPFTDKRLIEFCPYLPGNLRHRGGWPKRILRDAMQDRLPEAVLWARGKRHVGWVFNVSVTKQAIDSGTIELAALQRSLEEYVDPQRLAVAWRRWQVDDELEIVHTAHVLVSWLRENGKRPVVLSADVP